MSSDSTIRFHRVIAGASNVNNPALTTSGQTSEVLGPGRLHNVTELVIKVRWPANASAGEITIESASHEAYTGTWSPMMVLPWATGAHEDSFNFTGAQMAVRARASVTVDGDGVTIIAQGNG